MACMAVVATAPGSQAAVAGAIPGSSAAGFATPVVVMPAGEGITFSNLDAAPHNFVALDLFLKKKAAKKARWCREYDKGKCPLFWSPQIGTGESTEVEGVDRLASGQYAFFCSLHPNSMKGTLVIP